MENSSFSHDYCSSTNQAIPGLLENLMGYYHYKDCIYKCEHNIHQFNTPTKLSVYLAGDYNVQKNPPITLTMSQT